MDFELTPDERTAIRDIADERWNDVPYWASVAVQELDNKGLVIIETAGDESTIISLTPKGRRAHAAVMETGDGPEDLKALFSF